jgi:hypothetical protein
VKLGWVEDFIAVLSASPEDGGVGLTPIRAQLLRNALQPPAQQPPEPLEPPPKPGLVGRLARWGGLM